MLCSATCTGGGISLQGASCASRAALPPALAAQARRRAPLCPGAAGPRAPAHRCSEGLCTGRTRGGSGAAPPRGPPGVAACLCACDGLRPQLRAQRGSAQWASGGGGGGARGGGGGLVRRAPGVRRALRPPALTFYLSHHLHPNARCSMDATRQQQRQRWQRGGGGGSGGENPTRAGVRDQTCATSTRHCVRVQRGSRAWREHGGGTGRGPSLQAPGTPRHASQQVTRPVKEGRAAIGRCGTESAVGASR